MPREIQPKIYNYSKTSFTIDGVKIDAPVLAKYFKKYRVADDVYSIYYEQGGKSNYIKYKDGTIKKLDSYESHYEEQFAQKHVFAFECREERIKEKAKAPLVPKYKVFVDTIITESNVNKRLQLKQQYELERGSVKLENDQVFAFLDRYKKVYLKNSDWTQLPDVQGLMDDDLKAEWAAYRQALRELDKVSDPLTESFIPLQPRSPLV